MKLLQTLEVPMYLRQVKLSDKRRATYYVLKKRMPKIPKKYQNDNYGFKPYKVGKKTEIRLTHLPTGTAVIKNSKTVNTPRYKTINGQDIYSDAVVREQRNKIMQEIKDYFVPYVEQLERIKLAEFPIIIEVELHHPCLATNGKPWDVDNHFYIYQKAFQDVLVGHKDKHGNARCKIIIPDDHNVFVCKPPSPLHIPVEEFEDRKLVFNIYKCNDTRVVCNRTRNKLFNKFIKLYDEEYRPY